MPIRQALYWTTCWIISAIVFGIGIGVFLGESKAAEFANVYIIEKLLSFDNLFVFLMIFNHFMIKDSDRRRVLNWGLIGAVVLRALFIGLGVTVVQQFHWILYILGVILVYSAIGIVFGKDEEKDISESKIIKLAKSFNFPPMLVWIITIELSDIVFAIDSIPASLAISQDMFIIYSANIFAILGLRSLYFVIQAIYDYLPGLKYGIGIILAFIGAKMFLPLFGLCIGPVLSLLIVVAILKINIVYVLTRRIA